MIFEYFPLLLSGQLVLTVRIGLLIPLLASIMVSPKLVIPIRGLTFTRLKMSLIPQRKHKLLASQDFLLVTALVLMSRQTYNDPVMKKIYN